MRVIDENIELTEALDRLGDRAIGVAPLPGIAGANPDLYAQRFERGDDALELVFIPSRQHERGALGGECTCNPETDALPIPGAIRTESLEGLEEPIKLDLYKDVFPDRMPYYAEHVRRYVTEKYGNGSLFGGGVAIERIAFSPT